jgi:predicted transcriptional regulator
VSVAALARTTGVAPACIHALEAGTLDPDYELLLVLARGLGVSSSALVLYSEDLASREPEL